MDIIQFLKLRECLFVSHMFCTTYLRVYLIFLTVSLTSPPKKRQAVQPKMHFKKYILPLVLFLCEHFVSIPESVYSD